MTQTLLITVLIVPQENAAALTSSVSDLAEEFDAVCSSRAINVADLDATHGVDINDLVQTVMRNHVARANRRQDMQDSY